jgi:hypothetical protein
MRKSMIYILVMVFLCAFCDSVTSAQGVPDLARGFLTPPDSARPWVYWFWLNGNITKEGIKLDLEAMKRVGIGGVLIMEVDQGAPLGPVSFAGTQWRELFQYVISEAHRLGIQVNMTDDAGWNGSGGPWITPDKAMQKLVWTQTTVDGGKQFTGVLPQPETVDGYYRDVALLAFPSPDNYVIPDIQGKSALVRQDIPQPANYLSLPSNDVIDRGNIQNLTANMAADGSIQWDVPPGKWTLMRIGYTPTGAVNAPAPASGRGLECDKLSKEGSEAAFDGLIKKLLSDNRPYIGKTFVSTHIDSWENGSQNWTPRFREEFQRLRGYDPLPYLPVFAGHVVGSLEVSERFLQDVRQTVSDLVVQNYAGHMEKLAKQHGIRLSIEAYGNCVFDDMMYAGRADEPMAEFWAWQKYGAANTVYEMASAAHVYGKRILGAESFTSDNNEKWLSYPASIKSLGDWAFCRGVNRFVVHRYAMQPWRDRKPGMSMGPWGLHYERTETWWEQSKPWHKYLARCQYLLQQGLPVADMLYLAPEGAPSSFNPPIDGSHTGYKADGCPAEALYYRVKVVKGKLVLPDGMSYRALVLPSAACMSPKLLMRIRGLAQEGALIIAGSPPQKSIGLSGYPQCDTEVQRLAKEIWKLRNIIKSRNPEQVLLNSAGLRPDFSSNRLLDFTHRRIGNADVYFVSNASMNSVNASCQFRIAGKVPEIWNPDTGDIKQAVCFSEMNGGTQLTLNLEPSGSVFVVFRKSSKLSDPIVRIKHNGKNILLIHSLHTPIDIVNALWGPVGDAAHTKDVTNQVRRILQSGRTSFQVAELASEGDPAFNIVKTLRVEYKMLGRTLQTSATDPEIISFELPSDAAMPLTLQWIAANKLIAKPRASGVYEIISKSGRIAKLRVNSIQPPKVIEGSWEVRFPAGWGAPGSILMNHLISWTNSSISGVRFFSGTAVYRKTLMIPAGMIRRNQRLYLNLGTVDVIAHVHLNGKDLGVLWKPPFITDITDAAKAGRNTLEVDVTNLWPNRMIGDEHMPEDSSRNPDGTLQEWPSWLIEGKPSPTGRFTFTTWRLWHKNDSLLSSGLLGPVSVQSLPELTVYLKKN